jgi:hypothetical protein
MTKRKLTELLVPWLEAGRVPFVVFGLLGIGLAVAGFVLRLCGR